MHTQKQKHAPKTDWTCTHILCTILNAEVSLVTANVHCGIDTFNYILVKDLNISLYHKVIETNVQLIRF